MIALLALAFLLALFPRVAAAGTAPELEVSDPEGRPDGIVVTLHGGGWLSADDLGGGTAAELMEPWSRPLVAAGARVVNVDYRSGPASLRDTIAAVDWAAATWPRLPICTLGFSAGGHLALAADLRGRDLDCAVSVSGPLNLRRSSPSVEALAREFFRRRLRRLSPALRPRRVDARTMLVGARCDDKVPYRGQRRAAKALDAKFVSVAAGEGGRPLHCPTDARSYRDAMAAQLGFVARAFDRARPHR